MDVTPKLLEDVEFREKFRGYDPEEVDDFLERVAVAFGQLQEKTRELSEQIESANARAARAEARARDSSDTDDTLRRTLVLAQRTADAAIKEAEENAAAIIAAAEAQARQHYAAAEDRAAQTNREADEAQRAKLAEADAAVADKHRQADSQAESTLANAREQASRLLVDARQKADRLVVEAESTAVRQAEEKLARLTEDVAGLERRRDALAHDVNALDAHGTLQRERLAAVVQEVRTIVEDPSGLGEIPLPTLRSTSFDAAIAAHVARAQAPAVARTTTTSDAAADGQAAEPASSGDTAGSAPRSVFDTDSDTDGPGGGADAPTSEPTPRSPFAPGASPLVSRDPVGRDEPARTSPTGSLLGMAPSIDLRAARDRNAAGAPPAAATPGHGTPTADDGVAVSAGPRGDEQLSLARRDTSEPSDASVAAAGAAGTGASDTAEQPAIELGAAAPGLAPPLPGDRGGHADAATGGPEGAGGADKTTVTANGAETAVPQPGPGDVSAGGFRPGSPRPPVAGSAEDRPPAGLGTPRGRAAAEAGSSGAPPWIGTAPPPPPPPPPPGQAAATSTRRDVSTVPPPPPAPAAGPNAAPPAASAPEAGKDTFLEELRRAVGDNNPEGDDAIRFFEDRDPTDPALRFFEGNDDTRSRFRRR